MRAALASDILFYADGLLCAMKVYQFLKSCRSPSENCIFASLNLAFPSWEEFFAHPRILTAPRSDMPLKIYSCPNFEQTKHLVVLRHTDIKQTSNRAFSWKSTLYRQAWVKASKKYIVQHLTLSYFHTHRGWLDSTNIFWYIHQPLCKKKAFGIANFPHWHMQCRPQT